MNRTIARRALATLSSFASILSTPLFAHEPGAPFSGAILDPLALHHAHIEDEQRVNFMWTRSQSERSLGKRRSLDAELELGWSNQRYTYGFEAFIPFRRASGPESSSNVSIGDIEIRPIKYAFINQPAFVVSTASAVTLPTGDRASGFGGGSTTFAQHLFLDRAFGNAFVGLNLGVAKSIGAERGSEVEYGVVVGYSFIRGVPLSGFAPAKPSQPVVLSTSIELVGANGLSGAEIGSRSLSALPALSLWWPKSGWQLRAGMSAPLSSSGDARRGFLLQIGNHRNWDEIFTRPLSAR